MLNLELLKEKLAKALANETVETLSEWLANKRLKNHIAYFGNGNFENIESQFCSSSMPIEEFLNEQNTKFKIPTQDSSIINQYAMAA